MINPKLERFLIQYLRTDKIQHSGRDFYTHLRRTYELLEAWGNPQDVCNAGLFHSIYGTWSFRRRSFPIESRSIIRALIGEHAEFLVYVFCVTQRPRALIEQAHAKFIQVKDLHTRGTIVLAPRELDYVLEIEAANLLEQGGTIRSSLEMLSKARISIAAKSHIESWLAICDEALQPRSKLLRV